MSPKLFAIAAVSFSLLARADEPALRLTSPEDGAVFTAGEAILLKAEPRGTQTATIQKVEFVSRAVIGESTSAPFSFSWNQVPPGIYSISARATTAAGLVESWKTTIAVLPSNDQGRVLHVDKNNGSANPNGSATSPYRDIQAAIDAALNGDTIKVAAGEYRGAVTIIAKNLRLAGGYTGASSAVYSQGVSGDFTTRVPRSTHVLGEGADRVIDIDFNGSTQWGIVEGFTVSGGKLGLRAGTYEDPTGKYFFLMNNSITGNSNPDPVAGVAINEVSAGVFTNTISANTALSYTGLFMAGNDKTVGLVKGNLVETNISTGDYCHAAGIAFRGKKTTGTVTRNVVRNNSADYGAGIFVDGDIDSNFVRLSFNTVMRNKALLGMGEFIDGGATAIVENEIIAWNETLNREFGGAFAVDSGPGTRATLINCTVAYNASYYDQDQGGNGLAISEDGTDIVNVDVKNTIFWRNSMIAGGKEINASGNGVLKIDFSDIDEVLQTNAHLQLGAGIFRADPLFADRQNDDFHLKSKSGRWNPSAANGQGAWVLDDVNSPGLDTGDPNSIFQNETIPNGGRINLGAWGNTAEASRSGNTNGNGSILTRIRLLPGGVREISITGSLGRYHLQAASSLASQQAVWTDLAVVTNTTGAVIYQDIIQPGLPRRFYRARFAE